MGRTDTFVPETKNTQELKAEMLDIAMNLYYSDELDVSERDKLAIKLNIILTQLNSEDGKGWIDYIANEMLDNNAAMDEVDARDHIINKWSKMVANIDIMIRNEWR